MKLRIKGNSIRLRLGQSEVRRIVNDGIIEESIAFGRQRLEYVLSAVSDAVAVTASFNDNRIVVCIPGDVLRDWAGTGQVGISAVQVGGDGAKLEILIEKDFACINPLENEAQEDTFPHPEVGGVCPPTKAG